MFGRRKDSLHELIIGQREESRSQHEEIMARHEETMAHFRQREEEFKRLIEESERRTEESREYNREILLRNEKVYTSVIARLEKNTAKIDSSIDETRTQTQALLRLIDRFDQPGGAAAA
jgi:mevalonate kinase